MLSVPVLVATVSPSKAAGSASDLVWVVDSCGPKKNCIRWRLGSPSRKEHLWRTCAQHPLGIDAFSLCHLSAGVSCCSNAGCNYQYCSNLLQSSTKKFPCFTNLSFEFIFCVVLVGKNETNVCFKCWMCSCSSVTCRIKLQSVMLSLVCLMYYCRLLRSSRLYSHLFSQHQPVIDSRCQSLLLLHWGLCENNN